MTTSSCERRFATVERAFQEGRAGKGDLMAALRHLLRWEQGRGGLVHRLVPSAPPWPTLNEWTNSGFSEVFEYDAHRFQVQAGTWHPEWLGDGTGQTLEGPLFAEELRRFTPSVEPDPFLGQLGFTSFKSAGQREAVRAVLSSPAGSTLAVLLPTGGGKSLCGHLPALLDEGAVAGLVLVVVPTIALALDQQERLKSVITHPTAYVGGISPEEKAVNRAIRHRIRDGEQRIIFTSPESVMQSLAPVLYRATKRGLLKLFVVDEAHMVEHWGDEFRSAFQEIAAIRIDLLRNSGEHRFRTLLLTATLTETSLDSLEILFGAPGPFKVLSAAQLRPEPAFWAAYCTSDEAKTSRVLEAVRHLPRPLILYTTLVQEANRWYSLLIDQGYLRTGLMTGKSGREARSTLLAGWRADEIDVVVATSAFGLGVDKDDVRAILHACVPENLDRYYQEVGRGGRDGRASASLVLYTANDLKQAKNARKLIRVELGRERWGAMVRSWEPMGEGRYRVPVDAAPPYNPNADNDYNVAWNLRTLTLMARAGLIALDAEAPPTVTANEDMSDAEMLAAYDDAVRVYRNRRIIRPLVADHQSEAVWREKVESLRDVSYAAGTRSFQLMKAVLHSEHCVADDFVELYSIPAREGRRGVSVSASCGGCGWCRKKGGLPYELEPSIPWSPWPASDRMERVLAGEFGSREVMAIFHNGFDDIRKKRNLGHFVEWLAHQGVRNLVIPRLLREDLRKRLESFGLPVFFFENYQELHLQPYSTAVIITEPSLTDDLRTVLAASRKRVLLLPEGVVDPDGPHRRLRDVLTCRTFRYEEFMNRIGI
ncbi:MAG: protein DpdF [Candidatus Acidiferrales bacterium]